MIDKRVIERQIRKGKLDASAYKRTLEALPDVSDRVARDADGEPSRSAANSVSSSVSSVSSMHVRAPEVSAAAPDEALGEDEEDDEDDEDDDDDDDDDDTAPEDATASS